MSRTALSVRTVTTSNVLAGCSVADLARMVREEACTLEQAWAELGERFRLTGDIAPVVPKGHTP